MVQKPKGKKKKSASESEQGKTSDGLEVNRDTDSTIDVNFVMTTLELLDSGTWSTDFYPLQV